MKKNLLIASIIPLAMLLASCSGPLPVPEPRATLTVSFDLSVSRALTTISEDFQLVETGTVYLRQSGTVKYSQPITINKAAKSGSASFSAVVVGSYEVLVELHDSGSRLVYRGSAAADLHGGDNGTKSIPLERWIGSLHLSGSWTESMAGLSSVSAQLSKAGTTLYGSTLTLDAGAKTVTGDIAGIYPDTYELYIVVRNTGGYPIFDGSGSVTIAKGTNNAVLALVVKTGSITIQIGGDLTSPVITSGPSATPNGADVTVAWTTDENATSEVCYSTTSNFDYRSSLLWAPAGGDASADRTSHGVSLSGLSGGLTYYYVVVSTDASGNRKVSAESSFTVPAYWARTYGGSGEENLQKTIMTTDGGTFSVGYTTSFGVGGADGWFLRTDADGNILWQEAIGSSSNEYVLSVSQTIDGGYIAGGDTNSSPWVVKLNSNGSIAWQYVLNVPTHDNRPANVSATADGGCILSTNTGIYNAEDILIMKLDVSGNISWQKSIDGGNFDIINSLQQTADGGYILGGVCNYGYGVSGAMWIIKMDPSGNITWQKKYDATSYSEHCYSIQQTPDGGYIAGGQYGYYAYDNMSSDVWIARLDGNGNILWQKKYGGPNRECISTLSLTCDGGIIFGGVAASFNPSRDGWVVKLYSSGAVSWQKIYSGNSEEYFQAFSQAENNTYYAFGHTNSYGAGSYDYWMLRIASDGSCPPLGTDTVCTVIDTTCTPVDTTSIPVTTAFTATPGTCTVTDTACTVMQQAP